LTQQKAPQAPSQRCFSSLCPRVQSIQPKVQCLASSMRLTNSRAELRIGSDRSVLQAVLPAFASLSLASGHPTTCHRSKRCCPASRRDGPGSTQPSSLPRFAAIETLQREQDLTSLTPKGRLIAAQPVKRTGRQVGQADKRACEIVGWIYGSTVDGGPGSRVLLMVSSGREGVSIHAVDNLLALLMSLSPLSKLQQVFRLDLEQAALDGRGATQPP
jgi:hypothetical protein